MAAVLTGVARKSRLSTSSLMLKDRETVGARAAVGGGSRTERLAVAWTALVYLAHLTRPRHRLRLRASSIVNRYVVRRRLAGACAGSAPLLFDRLRLLPARIELVNSGRVVTR
jgi:hypothetical protein